MFVTAMKGKGKLTQLQAAFCVEYTALGRKNASLALQKAGSKASEASRMAAASRMLRTVKVKRELRRLNAEADKKAQRRESTAVATVAELKMTLTAILRGNLAACLSTEGRPVLARLRELGPALQELQFDKDTGFLTRAKIRDPIHAIHELNLMEGNHAPREVKGQTQDGFSQFLQEIRARKEPRPSAEDFENA